MAKPGDLDGVLDEQGNEAPAPAPEPAEAPEQAPEPEASASDEAHAEADDKPKRPDPRPEGYVTKEERDRIARERDEIMAENRVLADRTQKLIDRFFAQQQEKPAQKVDDDPMPDYQQDPLGWIGWRQRQDQREADQRAEQQQQWQKQEQEAREFQDTLSRATARFQKVVEQRPEMGDLYAAVRSHVANLYAQQGYPQHQIPDLVTRYEADVIRWARQEYIPIEDAIEQAAARFGVTVQPKAQEQRPAPNRDPETGQFTAAEAEKAARQRESQERNASLSSAPGAPVKKMTAKELASMSEADMWKMFDSVGQTPGAKEFYREMNLRS